MSAGDANIELVCFDLGRVLVRLSEGWTGACGAAGVSPRILHPSEAERGRLMDIIVRHETGVLSDDGFFTEVGELMGVASPEVPCVLEAWLQGPFPGIPELLEELADEPVKIACLSNTNTYHWTMMTTPGGPNYLPLDTFHHRFASHLIGHRKPDAAIYAHVEREAGVPGRQIVFFDDKPENIDGALARGWHAYQVVPERQPAEQIRERLAHHGVLNG